MTDRAICTVPDKTSFTEYMARCRTTADESRATNFFIESKVKFKNIFNDFRAQYDDLIITGDQFSTLAGLSGATTGKANDQLNALSKKETMLLAELKSYRRISDSADKSFLEEIMHGRPQKELAPSLQDAVLLLFWFSWLVMSITLVAVRWGSPGGGWRAGSFTLLLMLLVTLFLFALLNQIA
jgi:hypothetical protein